MTQIEQRTLEEVIARYDLEPNLRDVYVEGMFDQEVLSRCFRAENQLDPIVYEIRSVEIPDDLLAREGLTNGNKQRVLVFARELAKLPNETACRCLVDRDLDHWFGPLESTRGLVFTEHCSIELYYFTAEVLRDAVIIGTRARIPNWDKFLESMTCVLKELFAMRLADRELKWAMSWLPLEKHLRVDGSSVYLNEEFTKRLLMKNGKYRERERFAANVNTWKAKLKGDPRASIRGHDLTDLLRWAIEAFKGAKELASEIAIQRLFLFSSADLSSLLQLLCAPNKAVEAGDSGL